VVFEWSSANDASGRLLPSLTSSHLPMRYEGRSGRPLVNVPVRALGCKHRANNACVIGARV